MVKKRGAYRSWKVIEFNIFPGLESHGIRPRSWKVMENQTKQLLHFWPEYMFPTLLANSVQHWSTTLSEYNQIQLQFSRNFWWSYQWLCSSVVWFQWATLTVKRHEWYCKVVENIFECSVCTLKTLCLVSTIPLPFCCCRFAIAISLFRCAVAVLPFRSYRCRCMRERKCWKRLSV